jgi:hypothetical protein
MAFIIVQRQLYLWFVKLVQDNRFVFMQAPGLDAQGPEWHELYEWLSDYSTDVIAGDFKAFDITQDAEELHIVYATMRLLAEKLGASQQHLSLMEACEKDTIFPLINYFGTLIRTPLNPSGQSLTVIVNGLMNVLRTMTLYALLPHEDISVRETLRSFFDHVRLMTYGDDNIMTVRDKPSFNHTFLQNAYATMGITYTMADKEKESVPYITFDEATFLKRSWRYDVETETFLAPLDKTSMIKMLYLHIPSKVVSDEVQMIQTIQTNHAEWFHYGRETFSEWDQRLRMYAREIGVSEEVVFHTWDFYMERYMSKGKIQQCSRSAMCASCFHHCQFTSYRDVEDLRLCRICKWCRFDESDLDCLHCEMSDCCPRCGRIGKVKFDFSFTIHQMTMHVYKVKCEPCNHVNVQIGRHGPGPEQGHNQMLEQSIVTAMSDEMVPYRQREWIDCFKLTSANPEEICIESRCSQHQITTSDVRFNSDLHLKYGITEQAITDDQINHEMANEMKPEIKSFQTTEFRDANVGEMLSFAPNANILTTEKRDDIDLGQYLSRPVLISSHSWTTSAFSTTSIKPWHLWATTAAVSNKLKNYAFFKGDLKVKIVVNCSPFYYGALLAYYSPTQDYVSGLASTSVDAVTVSQRPHIWVYPQTSAGGELTLPFIYWENAVSLLSASNLELMGELTFRQYTALTSANGASTNGCTIQVYAWCENAQLLGPTTQAILQAKSGVMDEYGTGPISAPASALANWSSHLEKVPYIGKGATATRIGASAISEIAKLFGWSNVPVIEDSKAVKPTALHAMASAHISTPVEKLSYDPKAEISVDPSLIGLSSEDELSIRYLVEKESFITSNTWATSTSPGTQLLHFGVLPLMYDRGTVSSAGTYGIAMTPMCMVARNFKYWRGDIIFRFKVICSRFHQGRLRISWDPVGNNTSSTDTSHQLITKVVDLAESDEIEFRVPYMQPRTWSTVLGAGDIYAANNFGTTAGATYYRNANNGELTVKVLTNLSAPVDTATVTVLAFVRGAENLQFAVGAELPQQTTYLQMQSKTDSLPVDVQEDPMRDSYYLNYFGEVVPTLRIPLRRTQAISLYLADGTSSSNRLERAILALGRVPNPPGYDDSGYKSVRGVETPGTSYYFNPTIMNSYNWISPSFLYYRGSTRWKINAMCSSSPVQHLSACRKSGTRPVNGNVFRNEVLAGSTPGDACMYYYNYETGYAPGALLTNGNVQPCLEFECPPINNSKMYFTKPSLATAGSTNDNARTEYYNVEQWYFGMSSAKANAMETFFSVGTDFNLHFFLCVPVVYYNNSMGEVWV